MQAELTKKILNYVKKNKKYSSLSDEIIEDEIMLYFRQNHKSINFVENDKSEKFNRIVKEIRARLHKVYSSFDIGKDKRGKYLEELKFALETNGINSKEYYHVHEKILSTSVSSKERLKDYLTLYENIFAITGKPSKIVDLGSGINPLSFCYMDIDRVDYHAYEIDDKDVGFLNDYFALMKKYSGLRGKAEIVNLLKIENINKIPSSDVCFMFKLVDILDKKGHKLSEELIKKVKARWVVVSFSTKTVSGKKMNYPERGWIERMLDRIGYRFDKINLDNEMFYLIQKE